MAFSIPTVDDIKKSNKIKSVSEPVIFKYKSDNSNNLNKTPSSSAGLSQSLTSGSCPIPTTAAPLESCHSELQDKNEAQVAAAYQPHAVTVNPLQKKNPLMKHIRNVSWQLGEIIPDFELGKTTCALYLSIRYHCLYPDYIHDRLKALGKLYSLRILIVHVDTSESRKTLKELTKISLLSDLTLMLAWSYEEAARYLETYKAYENKPPDLLKERVDSDFSSRVCECLTTVKKISKTDAATLINTFQTMEKIIGSSKEELTLCPGLGPLKAKRLHSLFHESFIVKKKQSME